jgi:DNA-binding NarL/FixJ family response regulator
MGRPVRILLVDDHEVVRAGLRMLLEHRPNLTIVGEASTAAAAVIEAERTAPDVVIMDVRLPDGSGVEACREIRSARPDARVLMLTSFADEEAVDASVMAGASGYLLKQTRSAELIHAIDIVAAGGSLLDPTVTGQLLARFRRMAGSGEGDPVASLTEQERRVLALVGEGKTNREIAGAMHLSEKTIKNYVSTLLGKLHVQRRAAAATLAAKQKLP